MPRAFRLGPLTLAALLVVFVLTACEDNAEDSSPVATDVPDISEVQKAFPPQSSPPVQFYVLQPGDSLYAVALKFGVSIYDLIEANNISDARLLSPGQELKIPRPRALAPRGP